ncbi:dynein regulatory complex protein 10 [Microcaecilia unicolor]|uniref:Dynein regulatory complex protein 10 n=1 Tax=Microcaecilia unicolor TaxID=1415580 RepID=A0A6P7ZFN0_9AMPH|nr:dynein regulatory complex protein 10 [Microcaecilia unicolor]XP_030074393.1 dynein regulatory complex protein 10 [Microcaecilia unicolor]XP_030074394.1 dynein regulatory complex protein 10 [Microcaecilia unicolor]XP_030074396.1 dynein regulatory complex protein 10 [Microcaecilia unicolor]
MATVVMPPSQTLVPLGQRSETSDLCPDSRPHLVRNKIQKKTQTKMDALKILGQGRKKLTSIETQRIVSVLDETIKRIELASLFCYAADNLDRFNVVLGSELTCAIREHQRLQNNMQNLLRRLEEEGRGFPREEDKEGSRLSMEEQGHSLSMLKQGISSSVKNTLRLFQANPTACNTLRAELFARDPAIELLLQNLSELRAFLFERLLTSPLEESEKINYLREMNQRDKKNRGIIAALEGELAAAIQDRDIEISKKNDIIRQLKSHLHQLEKFSGENIRRAKQEAEKQQKADYRASESKCLKLQQELQQLRTQLNAEITEHREVELALRKKKFKVETEIENWIQKYDLDMGEKQEELEQVETVYAEEKAELKDLQEKLELLEQEYFQVKEEQELAQKKREEFEKELAARTRAATLIQAFWKGYLVRRVLRSKRKGRKGKRKGKKGKK